MRFLLLSLLTFSIVIPTIAQARNLSLECDIRYDIDDKDTVEIPLIHTEGLEHLFSIKNEKVETYFFPRNRGVAQWHMDATYSISAKISDDTLIINYNFKNYLRQRTNLVSVFDETRLFHIDYDEIDDDEEQTFDFIYGEVLFSKINNDDWINETGAVLDECTVFDLDLVKAKEEDNQTIEHKRTRVGNFLRRLFHK